MSSESRIWEIRLFGSMRGGRELVIGLWPFNPSSPAYSTTQPASSYAYPVAGQALCFGGGRAFIGAPCLACFGKQPDRRKWF